MHNLPKVFFKWTTAILYVVVLSVFFLAFTIVYNPFGLLLTLDMGRDLSTLNICILFAIIVVVLTLARLGLRLFLKSKHFTWAYYICWCIWETLLIALFSGLYITLICKGEIGYFAVVFNYTLPFSYLYLIYPYTIITLSFALGERKQAAKAKHAGEAGLIRFYDIYKKPKFLIAVDAILYIKAEENYVNIVYTEGAHASDRIKQYSLRASMTSIEQNCYNHGLVRCQRSYFVNPKHVSVLRKDGSLLYADLDVQAAPSIPVSKKYYENLSNLL